MATLMRKAEVSIQASKSHTQTAHKADGLARVIRILDDACSEPSKYVRIVRSQIGQEGRTLFTFNQINRRAISGDLDACEVMTEYVRQERLDGVPESVTDDQIQELWQEGVSLGRILSANPFKLANYYMGKGKDGAKPYVALSHMVRALMWCSEHHADMEEGIYQLMINFKEKFLKDDRDVLEVFTALDQGCVKILTVVK